MAITKERLSEFMRLYEEEFKETISEDEAREIASRLVELYSLLAAPLSGEAAREQGEKDMGQTGSTPR